MTVELTFDLLVDLKFLLNQFPLELKELIGACKYAIHASLSPDPGSAYRLVGSKVFGIQNGDTFMVNFVSDLRRPSAELQPLRVTYIEKL